MRVGVAARRVSLFLALMIGLSASIPVAHPSLGQRANASASETPTPTLNGVELSIARPGEAATTAPAAPVRDDAVELRDGCLGSGNALANAADLLRNRYKLGSRPAVTLPANPTWSEDPFHDKNWEFNYHSLRFILDLEQAWATTGDTAYKDRALYLLRDWYIDNPRSDPPSDFSWDDHATAWRAMVYACTAELFGTPTWLINALDLHGRTLASSSFYVYHGNHALNQAIGLLEVGAVRQRADWRKLAADRINKLVVESVTTSGVSVEQSIGYQWYNYARYVYARTRLGETGGHVSTVFSRIDLMPTFLGYATLPNKQYELIGDTGSTTSHAIPGTIAQFAATGGLLGPHPGATLRIYGAGYAFGRTGWGDTRPYGDEIAFSLKFGPGRQFHGHADGGALNLYGYGRRLIVGTGTYTYSSSPYRNYFLGRHSQNVVDVTGAAFDPSATTSFKFSTRTSRAYALSVRVNGYKGVSDTRTIVFSRRLGYMVVEDRLSSLTSHDYTQMWHLFPGAKPAITGATVRTMATGGSLVIKQLGIAPKISAVTGRTNPIQGWRTLKYGSKVAAPALLSRRTGRSVRFITLLVPIPTPGTSVKVLSSRITSTGFSIVVSVGGKRERVTLDGSSVSIVTVS